MDAQLVVLSAGINDRGGEGSYQEERRLTAKGWQRRQKRNGRRWSKWRTCKETDQW
jgi:hypothetical protein